MPIRRAHDPVADEATDAIVDGDRALAPGTAQAALRHRDFRVVWGGTFASNIGTWMQNVLLGAYGWELTHSTGFVGLLYFAQLGPLLFLSTIGGALADAVDRRRLVLWMQVEQLVFSAVLAVIVALPHPSKTGLVACVFAVGIGNALGAPALGAILPELVPRPDLPGAVSLQSVQMNLSRVIGPAVGAPLYAALGAPPVFALNAGTYLFAVAGLLMARYDSRPTAGDDVRVVDRLLSGFRIARSDPLIRTVLVTMTTFSFFSVTFVGLMPAIADRNLGVNPESTAYGLLYAAFGLGAAAGAISVGTFLTGRPRFALTRVALGAFAVLLAGFALVRVASLAFPVALVLGFAYFVVITTLSTILQEYLDDAVRGRVMALWIMAFGGTVPIGVLVAGYIDPYTGLTPILVVGAIAAAALVLRIRGVDTASPSGPSPAR